MPHPVTTVFPECSPLLSVRRRFCIRTSFEHRRGWIDQHLLEFADIFVIDIDAYAVMSNHYHVVLYIYRDAAHQWSEREVIDRWHRLFNCSMLSECYARVKR